MAHLLASLLALFVGPALIMLLGRREGAVLAIDAFVVMAIGGLVFFHILPHSVGEAGWPALVAAVLGLLAPVALHGPLEECNGRGTHSLLSLAVLAIALHAFLDGVALVDHGTGGHSLAMAVILHRVLEGLGVWWLVRPHHGRTGTTLVVSTIAVATAAGFFSGEQAFHCGLGTPISMIQAAVAGSLLHVLLRHALPVATMPIRHLQLASCAGGLLGVALLFCIEDEAGHSHAHGDVLAVNLGMNMAAQAAAPLLCAFALVAVSHAFFATDRVTCAKARFTQAVHGAWAGLFSAVCSCGVVPLYRNVSQQHTPPTAALAFLVAAPGFGFAALLMSWAFLGPELLVMRAVGVVCTAVLAGLSAGRLLPPPEPCHEKPSTPHIGITHRLVDGWHFALGEVLDYWAPWVLFGLGLAIVAAQVFDPAWFTALRSAWVEVPALALLGIPFYLSASAATLLGAALLAKGASVGAVLAFMLTSSAASLSTAGFLSHVHGRRVGRVFTLAVWVSAVVCGYLTHLWPSPITAPLPAPITGMGGAALVTLMALFLLAFLRQGVRPFLGQVAVPNTFGAHSHHHAHGGHQHHAPPRKS